VGRRNVDVEDGADVLVDLIQGQSGVHVRLLVLSAAVHRLRNRAAGSAASGPAVAPIST
jgi:hypothetical protein